MGKTIKFITKDKYDNVLGNTGIFNEWGTKFEDGVLDDLIVNNNNELTLFSKYPVWHQDDMKDVYNTNLNNVVVDAPDNLVEGDLIVAFVAGRYQSSITPPTGFTLIRHEQDSSSFRSFVAAYYKIATGEEPVNYTFNFATSSYAKRITISRVTDYNIASPIDAENGNNTGSSTTKTFQINEIESTFPLSTLFAMASFYGTTSTLNIPSSMTEITKNVSDSSSSNAVAYEEIGAGLTGTRQFDTSSWLRAAGLMFNIKGILETSGTRISEPVSLGSYGTNIPDLRIEWMENKPDDTTIKIETAITDSDSVLPEEGDWIEQINRELLTGVPADLTGKFLRTRITLGTTANFLPSIQYLIIYDDADSSYTALTIKFNDEEKSVPSNGEVSFTNVPENETYPYEIYTFSLSSSPYEYSYLTEGEIVVETININETVIISTNPAIVTQQYIEVAGKPELPPVRVTQQYIEVAGKPELPPVRVTQQYIEAAVLPLTYNTQFNFIDAELNPLGCNEIIDNFTTEEFNQGVLTDLVVNDGLTIDSTAPTWHQDDIKEVYNTNLNDVVVNAPDNLAEGDLIIAFVRGRYQSSITPPEGFTLIRHETDSSTLRSFVAAYYKIATDSEPANYTFNFATSSYAKRITLGRITNYNTDSPIGADNGTNSGSSYINPITIPGISVETKSLLFGVVSVYGGTTITIPGTMTAISTNGNDSSSGNVVSYEEINIGETGDREFSFTSTYRTAGLMFSVQGLPSNSTGTRISEPVSLNSYGTNIPDLRIEWISNELENTSVKIETAITDSDSVLPEELDWNEQTNGELLTGVPADLTGKFLRTRISLIIESGTSSPAISWIIIYDDADSPKTAIRFTFQDQENIKVPLNGELNFTDRLNGYQMPYTLKIFTLVNAPLKYVNTITGYQTIEYNDVTKDIMITASEWKEIFIGYYSSFGIKIDDTLWAWGSNSFGALGLGDSTTRLLPEQIGSDRDWKQVACGLYHVLAIKNDGTLWGWGRSYSGCLTFDEYSGSYNTPVQLGTDTDWEKVSAGQYFSLGLKTDGTLWVWGDNYENQLGVILGEEEYYSAEMIQINNYSNWEDMAAGYEHSIGLRSEII